MGKALKLIGTAVIFLIIAGAAALYWSAGKAQQTYNQSLAEANKQGVFNFRTAGYHKGLLSSEAATVVTFNTANPQLQALVRDDPALPLENFRLVFASDIEHLPDLFADEAPAFVITTRLDDQDQRQADWLQQAGGHDVVRLSTLAGMDGSVTVTLEVDPLTYKSPGNDGSLEWGGLQGTFDISEHPGQITGRINSSGLTARAGAAQFVIGGMRYDLDGQFGSHDLFTGTQVMVVEDVRLSIPAKDTAVARGLSIGRLSMRGEARESGESLSVSSDIKLTDLDAAGQRIPRFNLGLAADNLRMEPLAELRDMVQAINTGPAQSLQNNQALESQIMTQLMALLSGQPRMRITELALDTGSGQLQGNLAVQLMESPPTADVPPTFWLTALQGEAHVAISEQLLVLLATSGARASLVSRYEKQGQALPADAELDAAADELVRTQLALLETQGVLLREGEQFKTDIKLEQGELLVNGKSFQALLSGGQG